MSGMEPQKISGTLTFEEVNEPEFLARLLAKDTEAGKAFSSLVRSTHDLLLGFIRRHLSSADDCQEVLQEVYLAVHKGLPGFTGKSKLTTWMYSLTHHKICDRFSEKDRKHIELTDAIQEKLATAEGELGLGDSVSSWDAAPDIVLARNAVEGLIGKAIASLPVNARQVYQLRDIEGLSGEEAAEILGITPENVRVQLHRVRRQIVEWVQEKLARAQVSK
jgi:RNA polymerase sigma-70 factor, ECF subfamily